jgi:parvulin-like peptidyl-prolyl isomerase
MDELKQFVTSQELLDYLTKNFQLKEIYQQVIWQKIIEQTAQAKGIAVTPEEIQAEAERVRRERRLEKAADTLAWLADQMVTPDDWEAGIRDRLLKEKLAKFLFHREIEKYFAQNKLDFDRVLLYQFVVTSDKLAQELLFQIEEREISFYEAARIYDVDERRKYQCGYEGKLYRWNLKPDLAAVVFSARSQEVLGPLQTSIGYHLLMVEEFIPAQLDLETYQKICDRLFQEWLAGETSYWLHNHTS